VADPHARNIITFKSTLSECLAYTLAVAQFEIGMDVDECERIPIVEGSRAASGGKVEQQKFHVGKRDFHTRPPSASLASRLKLTRLWLVDINAVYI